MAKLDYGKDRVRQKINRQHIEDRTYGERPVRRKRKPKRVHSLSTLNKTEATALYSKLVHINGMKGENAFGIVINETFRLIDRERQKANKNKSKSHSRNRRKR